MKKTLSLIAIAFLSTCIFFTSCKKEELLKPATSIADKNKERSALSIPVLTVTCLTNRTLPLGGSFYHKIKLMNGINPIVGAYVVINDPIGLACTSVVTNALGEATWTRSIPYSAKQLAYTIEFSYGYGSTKSYSTVAVKPAAGSVTMPHYGLQFLSQGSLSNNTLVIANRGGFQSTPQSISSTLQQAAEFGKAVAVDYLSNPFSIAITSVAAVSCSATLVIPPAGAVCAVSAKMVAAGIAGSAAKVLLKKGVDASNFSSADKVKLKHLIDLGSTAYGIATLKPGGGIQQLGTLSTYYSFVNNTFGQLIYQNGQIKGASFPAQKSGSSEVYMMSIYNR